MKSHDVESITYPYMHFHIFSWENPRLSPLSLSLLYVSLSLFFHPQATRQGEGCDQNWAPVFQSQTDTLMVKTKENVEYLTAPVQPIKIRFAVLLSFYEVIWVIGSFGFREVTCYIKWLNVDEMLSCKILV